MQLRWVGLATLVAAVAVVSVAAPAQAAVIRVDCQDCGDLPGWLQVILVVIGLALAVGILYLPTRLARLGRTPRQRAIILYGGWLVLTVGLVMGARALVLLFPD